MTDRSRALNELIWDRLGTFWSENYDSSDRQVFSTVYEAVLGALDAERVRLYEIDNAKSVVTCPVFTQRRWLQIDLGRYAELKAWLTFLAGQTSSVCGSAEQHPQHWHLHFPWSATTDAYSVTLPFPTAPELVQVWFRSSGARAWPGRAYELSADKKTLTFLQPGNYEVSVGLDTGGVADGKPRIIDTTVTDAQGSVTVPSEFGLGYAVPALIVKNPPEGELGNLRATNEGEFATRRSFVPACVQVNATTLQVPGSLVGDRVLLFGLDRGASAPQHQHRSHLETVQAASPISEWIPTVNPGASLLFGHVGLLGHELRLFRDGLLVSPESYRYEIETNTFRFRDPLVSSSGGTLTFQLQWSEEGQGAGYHRHFACSTTSIKNTLDLNTFDDGGQFDDGGRFDDFSTFSSASLDTTIPAGAENLYADGLLVAPGSYFTSASGQATTFSFNLGGSVGDIVATWVVEQAIYTYGGLDLPPAITESTLASVTADLVNLQKAFAQQFPSLNINNLARLVEASKVSAAGGNPLLTLFEDEWPEYSGLPTDMAGMAVDAGTARLVESAQTQLIDIPFLQNHVRNPTVRLHAGIDYEVRDGAIQSDLPLEGVWWCPVVILDERLLAKNFGSLVGSDEASSGAYRQRLMAELMLRYNGPTVEALRTAAAAACGSAIVVEDAEVVRVREEPIRTLVTVTTDARDRVQTVVLPAAADLAVGRQVAAGQSLLRPLVFAGLLHPSTTVAGNVITTPSPIYKAAPGQRIRVLLSTGMASYTIEDVRKGFTVFGETQEIILDMTPAAAVLTPVYAAIFEDGPAPYAAFDGRISAVKKDNVRILETTAGEYPLHGDTVFKPGARLLRGTALEPALATVYSADTDPDWYRVQASSPDTYRTEYRYVDVTAGGTFGQAAFSPEDPALPRGTTFVVNGVQFTVVGTSGGVATVLPNLAVSGTAKIQLLVRGEFNRFELAARADSELAEPVTVGEHNIAIVDASGFPAMGRVRMWSGVSGQAYEAVYRAVEGNVLRGVTWPKRVPGAVALGGSIVCVGELLTERINPAFQAAVRLRTAGNANNVSLADPVVETYYQAIKSSTMVVEAENLPNQAQLRKALDDAGSAAVQTVLLTKHTITELVAAQADDTVASGESFEVSDIELSYDGTTFAPTATTFTVDAAYRTLHVRAVPSVAGPAWQGSTFSWAVRLVSGNATTIGLSSPFAENCQLRNLRPGATYELTFKATETTGFVHVHKRTFALTKEAPAA